MTLEKISIIIPVLNEAKTIKETLFHIQQGVNTEIIVVDGGSQDETVALALECGVEVIDSPPGRALQMNRGANYATGSILLFLHADTQLPIGYDDKIRGAFTQHSTIAGAFQLKIEGNLRGLRWVEKMVNMRSRFLSFPYGDQAIFLKTSVFQLLGGFAHLPIMEDFNLIQRLRKRGQIIILPASVITSGRRWQKLGVIKTTLINQVIIMGYFLGVSPSRLLRWYRQH